MDDFRIAERRCRSQVELYQDYLSRHVEEVVKTVKCKCGKTLSQPYARKMGECVQCCLNRLRAERGQMLWTSKSKRKLDGRRHRASKLKAVTSFEEAERKREEKRRYYREYRAKRRAQEAAV